MNKKNLIIIMIDGGRYDRAINSSLFKKLEVNSVFVFNNVNKTKICLSKWFDYFMKVNNNPKFGNILDNNTVVKPIAHPKSNTDVILLKSILLSLNFDCICPRVGCVSI